MSTWVDNQQRPRSTLEIDADTIGHDLAHGWSHYLRGTRPSGDSAAVNSGEAARQDTGTGDAGNDDDEYLSALEATGADEFEAATPVPGGQGQAQGDENGTGKGHCKLRDGRSAGPEPAPGNKMGTFQNVLRFDDVTKESQRRVSAND